MTQSERRIYLIDRLAAERGEGIAVPENGQAQKRLLRALFNVRPPKPCDAEFLRVQDAYLKEETRQKGVTDLADLTPIQPDIYLWQGDITTLKCDAIVNAANSALLGCFCPNHGCMTMRYTPSRAFSSASPARSLWQSRGMTSRRDRLSSRRRSICPAGMSSTRSDRSSAGG